MSKHWDVVIAGGGMVGLSLALHLRHSLPASAQIAVVESHPLPEPEVALPDHPSFDARSTALSYASEQIYRNIGVWATLSRQACAIDTVHVSNRGHFGSTLLKAADYDWPALGHVVENPWLGAALLHCVREAGGIELYSPASVSGVEVSSSGVHLDLDQGEALSAGLLIVADGANSALRASLGVAVQRKTYSQSAVVANVVSAEAHAGCAYERFTRQGPLALLPLPTLAPAPSRSALVWTLDEERAAHLSTCPEDEFLAQLQHRFGYRLGKLLQVGRRDSYPLALMQSREQVRRGIVVMGNAAHALHPVAGQGFNLALRDVAALSAVLAQAMAAGEDHGSPAVLQRYLARQSDDQARTIAFSDYLPRLFMDNDPLLGVLRDLGLAGLDLTPGAKREFVRYSAGLAALEEGRRQESGHG